jgi:zinc protease
VLKNVNVLMKSKRAELGYAIDSMAYGIPPYDKYVKTAVAKLTREDVNKAIRRYLRTDRLQIVAVAKNAAELKDKLVSGAPSPMTYNSPKPQDLLEEDKVVQGWNLGLRPEDVKIVPLEQVFQ